MRAAARARRGAYPRGRARSSDRRPSTRRRSWRAASPHRRRWRAPRSATKRRRGAALASGVVAAALLREALTSNSPLDSPQRARLLAALCRALIYTDRVDAALAIHGQAVAMARRIGDMPTLFSSLAAIVPARWRPDLLPLRLAAGREAMQMRRTRRQPGMGDRLPDAAGISAT